MNLDDVNLENILQSATIDARRKVDAIKNLGRGDEMFLAQADADRWDPKPFSKYVDLLMENGLQLEYRNMKFKIYYQEPPEIKKDNKVVIEDDKETIKRTRNLMVKRIA